MTQTLLGYAFLPWRRKRLAQRFLQSETPVSHGDLMRFLRKEAGKGTLAAAVLLWDVLPIMLAILTDTALRGITATAVGCLLFLCVAYTPETENESGWMLLKLMYVAFNVAIRGNRTLPVLFLLASRLAEDHFHAKQ